ncbi:ATP/GTP-binding protein [Paenibacillus enshidis]|uniref:ATP/GTP-binding protein n=1 Tax=Paenibacillus enshidis TaxID=1458439 RepID=A0ABV5B0A1_9BACL
MLIMFRAKNFSSFEDEFILDLRATSYREHPSHISRSSNFNLLKTLVIYGANASGKSNLISALYCYEEYIFSQLFQGKSNENSSNDLEEINSKRLPSIRPYLLKKEIDNCIEFEMIFLHKEILFQYGFSFEHKKVLSEWLIINDDLVYERDNSSIIYGNKYKSQLKNLNKYREDRLYLSVLDFFATDEIKRLVDLFKNFFQERFNVYFEVIFEISVKGTIGSYALYSKRLIEDEAFRNKVVDYIKEIDVGIDDIIVERVLRTKRGEQEEEDVVKTVHPIFNEEGEKVSSEVFDLSQESSGTLRFLSFIQEILILLENGGVFIIDELSARLHPLLTKFLVDLFQSEENSNNAQLIFTTHDTSLLNKEQFRRDEILFVDKNNKGESSLYSLADLKSVRKDASYSKDYFNGKYGAIPIFKSYKN